MLLSTATETWVEQKQFPQGLATVRAPSGVCGLRKCKGKGRENSGRGMTAMGSENKREGENKCFASFGDLRTPGISVLQM